MRIYGKDIDIQGEGANANISLSFSRTNMFSFGMDIPKCQILQPPITPMADYCCKYPAVIAGGVGLPVMNVCVNAISKNSVNLCIETAANGDVPIYELFKDNIICGCCRPVTPAVTDALQELNMCVCSLAQYSCLTDCVTGGYAYGCLFYEPTGYNGYPIECGDFDLCRPCFGIICEADRGHETDYTVNVCGCRGCACDWRAYRINSQLLDVNDYTFAWQFNNFVECASCWWECNCGVPIRGVPKLRDDYAIVFPNTRECYMCAPWSMCEWSGGYADVVCLQCYNWAYAPIVFCLCGNPTEVCSGYRQINCGAELFICDSYGWRVWYEYIDSCSAVCCGGGICCYRYGLLHLYYASDMPKAQCVLCCIAEQFWNDFEYQVYEDGCSIGNCGFGVSCTACSNNCLALSSIYSPSLPLFCYCLSYARLRCNCTIDYYGAYNVQAPVGYVNNSCIGCYSTSIASFGDEYFCPHASCRYCERVVIDGGWTTQIGQEDSMCYGCVCLPWIGNFFGCGIIDTIRRVVTTLGCYMNGADVYSPSGKTFAINCALDYCVYNCSAFQVGYTTEPSECFISCNGSGEGIKPLLGAPVPHGNTSGFDDGSEKIGLPAFDPICGTTPKVRYLTFGTCTTLPPHSSTQVCFSAVLAGYCTQQTALCTQGLYIIESECYAQHIIYDYDCRKDVALARIVSNMSELCYCDATIYNYPKYHAVVCGPYGKAFAGAGLEFSLPIAIDLNACYCYKWYDGGGCEHYTNIPWTMLTYDILCGCENTAPIGCCSEIPMLRWLCQPSKTGVRNNAVTLTTQPSDTNTILSNGVGSCFVWNGARYRIERIDNYNPTAATCLKVFGVMV